jgi:RNAse (barnase) inhibitor barstar
MDGTMSGGTRQSDQPPVVFSADFPDGDTLGASRTVVRVDGRAMPGPSQTFHEMAKALRFPAYFGHNWDALIDCLGDVGRWLQSQSVIVLIEHADALVTVEHLPLLVEALCLGSERAGAESDADGIPIDRQVTELHFVFNLSSSYFREVRARIGRVGRRMELTPTGISVW